MKTVDKALHVLDQFSLSKTEIGLSDLARMADLDKAATRRILVALTKHGFVEQSDETRKYRLGHGFLRLARIREATVPMGRAAREVADWLGAQTGETAHLSVPGPSGMVSVAHRLPARGRVIVVAPAQDLPYHATASGLVYLAFAKAEKRAALLDLPRPKLAPLTLTDRDALLDAADRFRAQGYAHTIDSMEAGVASLAMPFYSDGDSPAGAVGVAMSRADLTDDRRDALLPVLRAAVARMEQALTGFSVRS